MMKKGLKSNRRVGWGPDGIRTPVQIDEWVRKVPLCDSHHLTDSINAFMNRTRTKYVQEQDEYIDYSKIIRRLFEDYSKIIRRLFEDYSIIRRLFEDYSKIRPILSLTIKTMLNHKSCIANVVDHQPNYRSKCIHFGWCSVIFLLMNCFAIKQNVPLISCSRSVKLSLVQFSLKTLREERARRTSRNDVTLRFLKAKCSCNPDNGIQRFSNCMKLFCFVNLCILIYVCLLYAKWEALQHACVHNKTVKFHNGAFTQK